MFYDHLLFNKWRSFLISQLGGRKKRKDCLLMIICASGVAVGLKNWLRISTAVEFSSLDDGLRRIKTFYDRHAKKE